jgi:predicted dehydrogenase
MDKLRIVQVGTGGWGKSWLPFLHESSDWELTGLVSRGGANLDSAREATGLTASACHSDLAAAAATDADAFLITVPHHLHVSYARRVVEAGKHVLCEKPFSDDFAAARDLVAFTETTDRVLAISQNFRYRQGLHHLKALVEAGAGAIDSMQVDLREPQGPWLAQGWRGEQKVSPLLLEVLIHQVDMARFLCGADPVSVYCRAWNPTWSVTKEPASADVLVDYDDGSRLTYCGTWATCGGETPWDGEWRVRYENTVATWQGEDVTQIPADGQPELDIHTLPSFPGHDRAGVLVDFARAVRGEARFPTDGRDNLPSLAIIFAAMRSAAEERVVTISEIMDA